MNVDFYFCYFEFYLCDDGAGLMFMLADYTTPGSRIKSNKHGVFVISFVFALNLELLFVLSWLSG